MSSCAVFLSLLGIYLVLKAFRCRRGWRGRGGCGGGRRYRSGLGFLFERLDTGPGQEKAIREAIDEFKEATKDAKTELEDSVSAIGATFKSEHFDHGMIGEAWAQQDGAIDKVRLAAATALGQIHSVLDEKQRERLADMIQHRNFGWGGGYGPSCGM